MITTALPNLSLRFAGKKDVPQILEFIRMLAAYEKLSHEVVADEATLEKSLFGSRPVAEVILAEYKNKPVGFALFFHNFSTFLGKPGLYIEDLFVIPEMRGKKIGETLLTFLANLAVERGCGRLEWWVLDWNEAAIRFYKKLGACPMNEWTVFRITGDNLVRLAADFKSL
ncbi:MAG: GNAT family N-acetyltransferase [Calditrichales bacterium]|nr:MAG: GNAT family N-acetyltransferase [Calditrichales bacterium]